MSRKQLYENMSAVGLTFTSLSHLIEAAAQRTLTAEDVATQREEVERRTGIHATHPSERTTIASFVLSFFGELEKWMSNPSNGTSMVDLVQILGGEKTFSIEETFTPEQVADLRLAPAWYKQVLDQGKVLLTAGDLQKVKEKIGALFRKIPADTTLGLMALSFLSSLMQEPPNTSDAEALWPYLAGEKPIRYTVNVKGLYVWQTATDMKPFSSGDEK